MTYEFDRTALTPQQQAAEWMAIHRSGAITLVQQAEFSAWVEAAPENRAAFDQLQAIWDEAGELDADPTILALRELNLKSFNRPARMRWAAGAMAASLVAAVVGGWALFEGPQLVPNAVPGAQAPSRAGEEQQVLRTGVGQSTTAILKDGSTVVLDSDSVVRVRETAHRRLVELERGGAFFQVAKDPSRPFVVAAGGKTITALGTAFEARLASGKLDVTLVEGKVKVEEKKGLIWVGEQEMDLTAGWRLSAPEDEQWSLQRVDAAKELSWMSGRMTFFNDTLGQAVEKVNRYSDRKIILDPELAYAPIVGVFETGDTERFVRGMELAGIAQVGRVTDETVELVPMRQAAR